MKVGFSLGRCIRDIVNNVVDIEDVIVIIAGTKFETQEQLIRIVTNTCIEIHICMGSTNLPAKA